MQDVTTRAFLRLIAQYGAPDYFVTEYFRVHETSRPEAHILASIADMPGPPSALESWTLDTPPTAKAFEGAFAAEVDLPLSPATGRPVFAQLIGEHIFHIERTIEALKPWPIAGIDLNLGCPAPKVYKKNVGGGLLREPRRLAEILSAMRAACGEGLLTVKMRVGFADWVHYDELLAVVADSGADLVCVHGRTVKEMYRSAVHYDLIARAVEALPVPVMANGDITSVRKAAEILTETAAAGIMAGRHAIRNPWLFRQLHQWRADQAVFRPTLADVRRYIDDLWAAAEHPAKRDQYRLSYMKKFLNFVAQSVEPSGGFLREMRRAQEPTEMWQVCDRWLVHNGRADTPFAAEPYPNIIARPNAEAPLESEACGLGVETA